MFPHHRGSEHRKMETIVYTALLLLLAHLALGVILWLRVRKLYSYPGLLGFPVIGNLYYFYRTMFIFTYDGFNRYLASILEEHKTNGLFFHWLRGNTIVLVTHPEVVKKLSFHPNLVDKPDSMYGGAAVAIDGPFSCLCADNEWKLKRKEYTNNLKKTCVEIDYYNTFIKCADKMVDMILEGSHSGVDALTVCASVAMDISTRNLCGFKTSIFYHPEMGRSITRLNIIVSFMSLNPSSVKVLNFLFKNIIDVILKKITPLRKVALEFLDNQLKLNLPLQEQPLMVQFASRLRKHNGSEQTLMKEMQELFFSAGNITSLSLSNSINLLAVLPDIQERAWQEQYQIFGNDSRDPTIEDISQMHFLDRFIKEAFRYFGPSMLARWATADINIDGVTIPRNTTVFYHMKYITFDPKLWENPNAFDPDRFLDESNLLKYSFLPFGIGIRNCPGMYYATVLMKIILSKILRRLKIRPVKKDVRLEDIKHICYLTTTMENPPKIKAEKRM